MNPSSRKLRTYIVITAALASIAAFAQEDARYRPEDGTFSYVPPQGWAMREFGGMKYPLAFGPRAANFSPNIVVVRESIPGPLDEYVRNSMATFRQMSPGARIADPVEFLTDEGTRAVKLIAIAEQPDVGTLQHAFYLFEGGASKFTVTCTRRAGDDEATDRLFDAALKTFEPSS